MTERQKFDLIKKIGKVEIRNYHSCTMADVTINSDYGSAANLGFRPLVTYISQSNIAMTAPVLQEERNPRSWIVSFVMPADMKLSDLPIPTNSQVSLRTSPAHTAAVLPFSGITTESKIHEKESELRATLQREKLTPTGPMRIARFDPPWKPGFLRYNEVIISIKL
jgi:hypothetical protein